MEEIGVGSRKGITIILVATGDNYEWFTIKERKNDEKEPWKEELDVPDAGFDDRHLRGRRNTRCDEANLLRPLRHVYRIMGNAVANAFSVGKELA